MDLLSTVRKTGSRGGVNFSWEDVATSAHRENYLGHSLKAPVGRWAKGRDLNWYAKADSTPAAPGETDQEKAARERREELRKIKEAEEDAISRALGLPVAPRNVSGANAIEVDASKLPDREPPVATQEANDSKEARPRKDHRKERDRDRDSDRHHKRRHRSRDRERRRSRSRSGSRSRVRDGKRPARDASVDDRDRAHRSRRRSHSPDLGDRRRQERRRDDDQDNDRSFERRSHRRRSRSRSREDRSRRHERPRIRSRSRSRNRQRYHDKGL